MPNFITRLFSRSRGKDVLAQGGFEVLRRMTADGWTGEKTLEQYRKSLYVFACISKIAEKVASINLEAYRVINSRGETKQILAHPALDLLYKCNPFQTRTEFWETTIINLKTTGDAYWLKIRNNSGKVVELWNMRPDWVTIIPDEQQFVKGYKFVKTDGTQIDLAAEDVVHFKYPDPLSQYLGMSPLQAAKTRVQTEDYATRFQRDFFVNSARPDAVIKNPQLSLTESQKREIREGWDKRFKGIGNSSKVAILEGGMEYQLISITQKDMDYIEGIKMTRDDILTAFKMPKPIIGITEDVNYANAKTAMAIFLGETIKPEIARIVEKINEELIVPDFGEEFFIDFEDPTPENREQELLEYSNGTANDWLLPNEIRAREGLPPVKGGWTIYRPLTDVAVGGLDQASQPKMRAVKMGGKTKSEAYEVMPTERVRTYDFRGHFWLLQKFLIKEEIEARIKGQLDSALKMKRRKQKKGKKKTSTPFLNGADVRRQYVELVNKRTDARASTLKDAVDEFSKGQEKRVQDALKKAAKSAKAEKKPITVTVEQIFDVDVETSLSIEFITPYLSQFVADAGAEAMDTVAPQETFSDTKKVRAAIRKRAQEFGDSVTKTTLEKLSGTLAEGITEGEGIRDLANRVEEVYSDFPAYRSELIARTEATIANNQGMIAAYEQSGVANGKEWINAGDDRVREEHQDAPVGVGTDIVPLDGVFKNGLAFPSEPNCRCVLGPAFIE